MSTGANDGGSGCRENKMWTGHVSAQKKIGSLLGHISGWGLDFARSIKRYTWIMGRHLARRLIEGVGCSTMGGSLFLGSDRRCLDKT